MKKHKLGMRKIKANLEQDARAPDEEEIKFGRHILVIKRIREKDKSGYLIWAKGHKSISIEGDASKEELILELIDQHRNFFALKERVPTKAPFEFSKGPSSTAADGSMLEELLNKNYSKKENKYYHSNNGTADSSYQIRYYT